MAERAGVMRNSSEEFVLQFLRENFYIAFTKDEFGKMDASLFCLILAKFLEEFGVENYAQMDLCAIQGLSDIERYEDTTQIVNIWKSCQELLNAIGINDFMVGDILVPKKAKVIKVIVALIRLWNIFADVYADWSPVEQQYAEVPARRKQIEIQNKELQQALETNSCFLSQLKADNEPQDKRLRELIANHISLEQKGKELKEESQSLKLELMRKQEYCSAADLRLCQLKKDIEENEAQIVHSPDKINMDISSKEKQLENLREEKTNFERKYAETVRMVENVEVEWKDFDKVLHTLKEVILKTENLKNEVNKTESNKSDVKTKECQMNELITNQKRNENFLKEIKQQKSVVTVKQVQNLKPIKEMISSTKEKLDQINCEESEIEKKFREEEKCYTSKMEALEDKHRAFEQQQEDCRKRAIEKLEVFASNAKKITDVTNLLTNN